MRRGLLAVLVSFLVLAGVVFVGESHNTVSAAAHRSTVRRLTLAKPVNPAGQVLGVSTSTTATLTVPLVQPLTAPPALLQDIPVSTSLLAAVLAAFENDVSAKLSTITTPPPFPQQVAANGNGILSYGAAAAASSGGGGSGGGVSASDVSSMIASAIQAAFSAIDHLTANIITATNSSLGSATATTLHVTGSTTLDTPLSASSGGTGVSTAPAYGQLLMGQANGTYALVSTSSLGIPGGTGAWGAITGTLSNQTDLQNALNVKLSLAQWYATTTSALAEGSNLYFTNARADARINATSSIGTLIAASNLASVGTITSGTWDAAAIGTGFGGTGLTTAPSYGQLFLGQSNGAYALVATSSLGVGSGTVNSGTQGQFAFYNAGGTTLAATSSLFLAQSGNIGIGTTSPFTTLGVNGSGYFSGTLTAPVQDKGGQVYNVKAFGAKGDGVTDDTAAINSAMTAGAGKKIYFPPGTYLVSSSVQIPSNTTLYGDGQDSVITCPSTGWYMSDTTVYGILNLYHTSNIEIYGLHVTGTKNADASHSPKLINMENTTNISIHDNIFDNMAFEGIFETGSIANTTYIRVVNNRFDNIGFPNTWGGLPAIQMNASHALISGNVLTNVGTGIGASGQQTIVSNNTIINVHWQGIGTGDGARPLGLVIEGNRIELIPAASNTVTGIALADGSFFGISTDQILVSDNHIKTVQDPGTNYATVGIYSTTAPEASITNNVIEFIGRGTGIRLYGTNTGSTFNVQNNTIRLDNENAMSFGIHALPNGSSNSLTVTTAGNRVYGMTRINSSFAYDFNTLGGGSLIATNAGDQADGGFYQYPSDYINDGSLDNTPIYRTSGTLSASFDSFSAATALATKIGIGTTSPWGRFSIVGSGVSSAPDFVFADSNNTPHFVIQDNGNVGIGTTNPNYAFQIASTGKALIGLDTTQTGSNNYKLEVGGDTRLNNWDLSSSNSQLLFIGGGLSKWGNVYNGDLSFVTNNVNRIYVRDPSGNVGIGTTNAQSRLDVNGGLAVGAYAGVSAAPTNGLIVSGNLGIGTTSPDMLFTVGSNSPSGSVAHFENSTGSCYINPTTTSLSCSSDSRLKTNVVPLDSADGLAAVLKLNPVTYNWKTESATTSPHTGFIAQDVQPVLPDLVSRGPDGYYTLNYAGLTPYLVKAVQEIATLSDTFKTTLINWLADAQNGITDFFAQTIHTQKLCTTRSDGTQVCVTNDQLAAVLSQAAASNPSTSATSSGGSQVTNSGNTGNGNSTTTNPVTTPPVISINGANTATITTGTIYADLGATITAPKADLNLGITLVVDNATSTDGTVQIDTSKTGTHTILYTVTDPSGLTGSATRTVIISAPQQPTQAAANDNTTSSTTSPAANDNTASSTSATSTAQ